MIFSSHTLRRTIPHLIILGLIIAPSLVFADSSFVPLTQLPGIKDAADSATLPNFLNQLYKILIGVGAVLAVIMIMIAGAQFMTNKGSVMSNEKAKDRISNAILGLILLLSPTIVFTIINPDILKLNINVSELQPSDLTPVSTSPTTTTNTCAQNFSSPKIVPSTGSNACKTAGSQYVVAAGCCDSVPSGSTCCAVDSSQSTADAAKNWMWRGPFENASGPAGSGRHTEEGGPFATQAECNANFSSFLSANQGKLNMSSDGLLCDCTKQKSEFGGKC